MSKEERNDKKKEEFIGCLEKIANVSQCCERVGLNRQTVYLWKKNDPDFAARWEEALDLGADALEDEAIRRAYAGSDTLLIFLLKGNKPEKFKERVSQQVKGQVDHNHDISERMAKIIEKKQKRTGKNNAG